MTAYNLGFFFKWKILSLFIVFSSMSSFYTFSQVSNAPKPFSNTYLLKNCQVVPHPGRILLNQNILIKDGLIQDVGTNFKIPFDAKVIDADNMYVYSGFIDGYSHTGIAKVETKETDKKENINLNEYEAIGVTPHVYAKDKFVSSDKSVAALRNIGVTVAHVIPIGGMLSGKSDIITLGEKHAQTQVIKSGVAQHFHLKTASGQFPSTIIGVMSKFQEIYQNAANAGQYQQTYNQNPNAMPRPNFPNALAELYPCTQGLMPIIAPAAQTKDIHRMLDLQKKLNFKIILTHVQQSWHMIDEIKKSKAGLFLSLDLPEWKKDTTQNDKKKYIDISNQVFEAKKDSMLAMHYQQAGMLEKAGIEFGFSFEGAKPDKVLGQIRTMVDQGLSQEAALKALTTSPAKLLSIDKVVGTVEKGKLAHLVLLDKPMFDEKATIKYVFVDGDPFKMEGKTQKKATEIKDNKYLGEWSYSIEIMGSERGGKLDIKNESNTYVVEMTSDDSPDKLVAKDVSLEDNKMVFSTTMDMGQEVQLEFNLTFDKDSFTGTVNVGEFGSFPLKGQLVKGPDFN